jgi:ATP-dependent Clp protease ATP-binding subunit ClpC
MIITPFSPEATKIIKKSEEEAVRLESETITPELLLLALVEDDNRILQELFSNHSIHSGQIRQRIEQTVNKKPASSELANEQLYKNDRLQNILRLAVLEARIEHTNTIEPQHLLLAILHDSSQNGAKIILEDCNMTYDTTKNMLQRVKNGIGLTDEDENTPQQPSGNGNNAQRQNQRPSTSTVNRNDGPASKTPVLDNFSTDLTMAAEEGKLDPCVGRENEIQRVIEILCRRKKNNPILIGEPGVGKSAIVEGLAQLIAAKKTSPILFNKRLLSLDMTGIVAGTKYRGQFEERIKAIIKELENNDDIIIFIDEIHTIIGAGSTPGSMDAANILKPALARGTIQCIGATTLDEYRNSIEKDGALERRFQKIQVEPTNAAQTLQILNNIKERYEDHHHVEYSDDAIMACVKLTDRYINDRCFPDKAIDVLDEVGARIHLRNAHIPPEIADKEKEIEEVKQQKQNAVTQQDFEKAAAFRDRQTQLEDQLSALRNKWLQGDNDAKTVISDTDVADVVSMMTGIPVQKMADAETIMLKDLSARLKASVIAQDKAIDKLVKSIQRNRIGLREPNHPIGVFMFLGPTGVGKTYLAKKLAEQLFGSKDALIRVDMNEYSEAFNVSRLVGAPPGYVGYEEGGQLTEKVRRHPYSIVLLDEIEKAHGNVFNLLLQVLDEGMLTDGNGRNIDFRNTVIIMTSNAGTRQLKEFGRGIGFTSGGSFNGDLNEQDKEYARQIIQKSLSRQFAPEFLNRLDEIITFDQLCLNDIKQIIDIELKGLYERVENMGYHLQLTESAKEFVATKGYDVQFGARPLKRAIQNYVEDLVCERLLDGHLSIGQTIIVDKHQEKDELVLNAS